MKFVGLCTARETLPYLPSAISDSNRKLDILSYGILRGLVLVGVVKDDEFIELNTD